MQTTFLEFVLTQYLGIPAHCSGNGVSYWLCPVCGSDSFRTLPDKPQFKHRAKCWNPECGFRGDVADMLKEFHPDEPYNERLDRKEHLQRAWEEQQRTLAFARGASNQNERGNYANGR